MYGCLASAQVVLAVQLVLCLSCAAASLHWRQAQGFSRYHLALDNFSRRRAARQATVSAHAVPCCLHLHANDEAQVPAKAAGKQSIRSGKP